MRTVKAYPPNYADIVTAFPRAVNRGVLFAYGDTIFAPSGIDVPQSLIVHEHVHGERQSDPADWWRNYISDPKFRFAEELLAHRAEYNWMTRNGNRHDRRAALSVVAKKLASPLYWHMCTFEEAKRLISA